MYELIPFLSNFYSMRTSVSGLLILIIATFAGVLLPESLYAQVSGLGYEPELAFRVSDEQKSFFRESEWQINDLWWVYMASSGELGRDENWEMVEHLQHLFASLKEKNIRGKSPSRQVNLIFREISERFLGEYQLNSTYYDLLRYSKYNNLTACALFAQTLTYFEIPFTIRTALGHYYLVVYPQTREIVVRPFWQGNTYFEPSGKFKQKFLRFLVQTGISPSGSAEQIFERYYFPDTILTMRQLGGLLYYQNALFHFYNSDYDNAVDMFEKAYFLYPDMGIKYQLFVSVFRILAFKPLRSTEDTKWLVKLYLLVPGESSRDIIRKSFSDLTREWVDTYGESDKYRESFLYFCQHIPDRELLNDLAEVYIAEMTRYYGETRAKPMLMEDMAVLYRRFPEINWLINGR